MKSICLAIARFRSDRKEAISKNFVQLAEGAAMAGHRVTTYTPTSFATDHPIEQRFHRASSRYASLWEAVRSLKRICDDINRNHESFLAINFHIATPVELLLLHLFLKPEARRRTLVSIWQAYLSWEEFKGNACFFLRNVAGYAHILLLNSFVTAILYRLLLHRFSGVIVHSEYQREQLGALTGQHVRLVRNGVMSRDEPVAARPDNPRFELLYIGHAKASKGIDKLLELTEALHRRGRLDFSLTMSLSGFGREERLERMIRDLGIEERVRLKREVTVFREMEKADLFVLPLRTCIGTSLAPNVIVEALSVGLPIAVPDYPELAGVVEFGVNALKLDLSDIGQCALTIERAAEGKGCLEEISKAQRAQFMAQYTREAFVDGYLHELLTTKGTR